MDLDPFLTEERKDFIQRTMLNIVCIIFAAALASKFFTEFSTPIRIGLFITTIAFWILGLVIKKWR